MPLARDALRAAAGTGISRLLGLAREAILAHTFGASGDYDAFLVAFFIPNLLRRLLGEGGLAAAFIPRYVEARERGEGDGFLRASFTLALLLFPPICLLGSLLSPFLIPILAGGFPEGRLRLAAGLARAVFPFIGLVALSSLLSGVLNVGGSFFLPALSPIFFSLGLIWGALSSPLFRPPVYGLAAGLLAGGLLQVLVQGVALRDRLRLGRPWHPGLLDVGRRLLPALFGLMVAELNALVDNRLASGLAPGSIAVLQYSMRLFQLPIGLVAVSLSTAILPSLSRYAARGGGREFAEELTRGISFLFTWILPAMAGLYALGEPIISLLFGHGAFLSGDVGRTAACLRGHLVGLWGYGLVYLLSRASYALGRPYLPVATGAAAVGVNIVLDIALVGALGAPGLALATGIAGCADGLLLCLALRGRIGWRPLLPHLLKAVGTGAIIGSSVWAFDTAVGAGLGELPRVAAGVGLGGAVFLLTRGRDLLRFGWGKG